MLGQLGYRFVLILGAASVACGVDGAAGNSHAFAAAEPQEARRPASSRAGTTTPSTKTYRHSRGEQAVLELRFSTGGTKQYELAYEARKTFLNGQRFYVTDP